MVPSVLMQFNNVPFQITLNIRYRSTHLKAFVLSNFNRHMKEYHEKVYLKTVDKLHQKACHIYSLMCLFKLLKTKAFKGVGL